jgi:serine kinase of HPr protein (carbohydrate metabolism regulator)
MMAQQASPSASDTVHASCVAIDGNAILLFGPSGSGKSDLALRLVDRGAQLVSDDYTILTLRADGVLTSDAPPNIAGKIEIRGIGIVEIPCVRHIPVRLALQLTSEVERLPLTALTVCIIGVDLPLMRLSPFEISSTIKAEWMLRHVMDLAQRPT